jgi:hypothetical protein
VSEDDPDWRAQIEQLGEDVLAWTGNYAAVIERPEQDISRLRRSRPPVVENLLRDGIDLAGVPLEELLGAANAAT